MALTKIRGSQIQDHSIGNAHIDPTSPIVYSNLDLSHSIVATDLSTNHTVHTDVLDYKLVALWDLVQNLSVTGTSAVATAQVQAAAVTDTATNDGSAKGILTTGTGVNGAGIENYKAQVRDAITKDPVNDGIGGTVYGELTYSGGAYTLAFKKSDGSSFSMGAQEQVEITTDANTNNVLHGKWFVIASPTAKYRVILNYVGDPALTPLAGVVDVNAPIANNDDGATVATAIRAALNGISSGTVFTATGAGSSVVVTTVAGVVLQGVSDGSGLYETDFQFATLAKGSPSSVDFMFEEIYSLNSAPLKGFVTGTGFTDVVTVTGTHNHNDLYYSKSELEAGQLDDRYYTKGELNAGQLDNRYFTESELTGGSLDGRYYTESELGSTAEGSSGASKIGLSGVTGLVAGTVQGALAELQGDIDNITAGNINIDLSLDDAYNDGSDITVDTTDVTWTMSAGRAFKLADGTDANKFVVSAGTALDSIKMDTSGGVNIKTKVGFEVTDDSAANLYVAGNGSVGLVAGPGQSATLHGRSGTNIFADTGSFILQGNAVGDSAMWINTGNGGIDIDAAMKVDISAGTILNLKDANLAASLPLSQTGVTGLSANLSATSIVGAINENADELNTLITTTLPATTDGAAGADKIGATGITGVIPTGGTIGSNGTVQSMLEGIAMGAGGGKTFANIGAFTTAKSGGTYFKLNEPVFILDINRWVIVEAQGTGVVEDTDWHYAGNVANPEGGEYKHYSSYSYEIGSTSFNVDAQSLTLESGVSGGKLVIAQAGTVGLSSKAGSKLTLSSDTETEINGGALVDINGTSVTIDGALAATGAANDMMTVTSSGLGETRLVSEKEIDLTGGDIDINAGATKTVSIDSDTLVALNGGAEVDLTATLLDLNGAVDMDGETFDINATGTGASAVKINSAGGVDIDTKTGFFVLDDSGAQLSIVDGIDITAANGYNIDVTTSGVGTTTLLGGQRTKIRSLGSANDAIFVEAVSGGIDINAAAGKPVTIDAGSITETATTIALNGKLTATNTVDQDMTLTTSGVGQVKIVSEKELNVNAPYTSIAGDVTMPVDSWLSVGNIKVTSVDPTDEATISGSRSGTVNALNKLSNTGFELGSGNDATNWTEAAGVTRTNINRYYGSYSMKFAATDLAAPVDVVKQAVTVTAATEHKASVYVFGTVGGAISTQIGTGTAAQVIPAGTYATWTRFDVTLANDNPATGDFKIIAAGTGTEDYNCYIDAVMLEEGNVLHDYFTDYKSELVFTIGDEDDDRIVFRSSGTATQDLVRINQSTVEILGNLLVSGTTTTVNSQDLLVADNQIVLNSNVTGAPSLDAYFKVERGTSEDAAIRWNESTDKWELTTDGTTYNQIVVAGSGGGGLSMDSAYDGGSSVTVDNTDVVWTLGATKKFAIADGTDTNKFVVSAGSGADSVKIDTAGGIIASSWGDVSLTGGGATSLMMTVDGTVQLQSGSNGGLILSSSNGNAFLRSLFGKVVLQADGNSSEDAISVSTTGGIVLHANNAKPITMDSGSFSIDGVLASNVSTTGADLTLSTITSGTLNLIGATAISGESPAISLTAVSGNATVTSTGTGETRLVSAQEIDLTGGAIDINAGAGQSVTIDSNTLVAINGGLKTQIDGTVLDLNGQMDFDGDLFDVNVTGTGVSALKMVSAGGIDVTGTQFVYTHTPSSGQFEVTSGGEFHVGLPTSNIQTVSDNAIRSNTGKVIINTLISTANDSISVTSDNGGIDIDAAAGKPITIDSGSFSIDGVLASNVSVTGNALTLSTLTSGDLNLTSAGELVFSDSRLAGIEFTDASNMTLPGAATSIVGALNAAWNAAQGANTLDEVYDGETGTRIITMDNGSVEWRASDNYAFSVKDAEGANILSAESRPAGVGGDRVKVDATLLMLGSSASFSLISTEANSFSIDTMGGIDIDTDAGFTLNDDSGALFTMSSAGAVALTAASGQSLAITTSGAGNASVTSGAKVTLTSGSTATDSIGLVSGGGVAIAAATDSTVAISTSGTGQVQLSATAEVDITGGAIDINGGTDKDITIDAIGTGKVLVTSANAINLSAGATSEIKTTSGDLTVRTTGTGGELYIGDGRTGSLKLSDAANSSLPGGATSILAAIKAAYDNKGTEVSRAYHEVTAGTTDVSNDYVVTNISLLPATGTFPMSPSALRSLAAPVHAVVYLNGLRLSDTEWRYSYDEGTSERRITFDGSNNITLVPGDLIMIDVEKITTVTA